MARRPKKEMTYRYFIRDKEGNLIDYSTLTEEEQKEVGIWAYQGLLKGLGYAPVEKK